MTTTGPGYVDLHCHYLPGIDDGVETLEDGVALCRGLAEIGYARVVATPHIRTAMFENRKPGLEAAAEQFAEATRDLDGMPELGLGAEHFFDDVFWQLFLDGEAVAYPGGHAALVELPSRTVPIGLQHAFFEMQVKGVRPVLAHPERYAAFVKKTGSLDALKVSGALPLLDVMSLVGRYGRRARRAAERMLQEDVYYAACSDCHRVRDVAMTADAIARLHELVGASQAQALLSERPQRILEGDF